MWDKELIPTVKVTKMLKYGVKLDENQLCPKKKSLLTRTRSRKRYTTVHTQQIIEWRMLVKHHLSTSED